MTEDAATLKLVCTICGATQGPEGTDGWVAVGTVNLNSDTDDDEITMCPKCNEHHLMDDLLVGILFPGPKD